MEQPSRQMMRVAQMEKIQNNYTVYKHTTPSGKTYIGITSKKPEERWLNGRGYKRNNHFWHAIKKYGWDNIQHEILATGLTREEAGNAEKLYIAICESNNPEKGYNLTDGGEKGAHHTEESRRKLSEAAKGHHRNVGVKFTEERKRHLSENHADVRGEKNPNWGKTWTAEQIAIRQAHREYKRGSEHPGAKPILQLDKEGNLVKRWGSITDAAQEYCKTCIKDCLRGKYKYHKGYQWRYENE